MPSRMAQSLTIIVGQYDEYSRKNELCRKAIEDEDENSYQDYAFLRENALILALNEIKIIAECLKRRYGTNLILGRTDTIEDKLDAIADFCELYYSAGCREAVNFR